MAAFHAAIAFSICYIAMQLTNWNQEFSKTDLDKGSASMWIKIVSVPLLVILPLSSPCNLAVRAIFFPARGAGPNGSLAVLFCVYRFLCCAVCSAVLDAVLCAVLCSVRAVCVLCCNARGLDQVDSWILALAYGWSMIAPKVLTGRSFDH